MNKKFMGIVDILLALFDIVMVVVNIQAGEYIFAVVLGMMAVMLLPLGIFLLVNAE